MDYGSPWGVEDRTAADVRLTKGQDVFPAESGHGRLIPGTVGTDRRAMTDSVVLSVRGVSKSYKRRAVLSDVSFEVRQGEALAVVGENGAGKTTLLRICAGAVRADSGDVARVASVAYCPQDAGLIEQLTASEHLRYVGAGLGMSRDQALARGRRCCSGCDFRTTRRLRYGSCPAELGRSSMSRWR